MRSSPIAAQNIDDYISGFPPAVQAMLGEIRATIQAAVPEATETIKYGMPTFVYHGDLVYFGAFKQHIGFYPVPSGLKAFEGELSVYTKGKGSVQFPLNKPLPLELITNIVYFRVQENLERILAKKKSK